ncbi:MAG: class I SAM-dependent methyltransferase [Ilumatobacter sp.]|uniref:class I SAM-dependent methyltransferase n=1 Tax=Ilumatobacter sp. TaxID=1967498 RepID=UPI003C73CD51
MSAHDQPDTDGHEPHDHEPHDHELHDHQGHEHHGHENDQGIRGALRYLRWLPEMWRSEINDAIVDLVAPQRGERVVDIGAGLGAGAMRVARSGAEVLAVEPTPFVRRALTMRRFLSRHRARLDVVDGAAEAIPAPDRSVDAVMAVNTMHHWIDVERGVAEIARVLRPTGRLLLVDEDFTDPAHPDHERFGGDGHDGGPEHHGFTMIDAEAVGTLLRAAGLTDVDTSTEQIERRPVISVAARGRPVHSEPAG